jgi:hypothetical protein
MRQDDTHVRLELVRERIRRAARRAGRDPEAVTLLAASKLIAPDRISAAIHLGIKHLGENRVQEAESKFERLASLRHSATWHLIGPLQSNKVRRALASFDVIQSVDRIRLAQQIERVASEMNRQIPIYVEVNVGAETSKSGVLPDHLIPLAEAIAAGAHLELQGLMTVPPYLEDPEAVRPYFKRLRELRDAVNREHLFNREVVGLSMGMSHDFEVAIEEGATLIRIGTALWGPRPVEERPS